MDKILSAKAIQRVDKFTIERDEISSAELMERASFEFAVEFVGLFPDAKSIAVFCGLGNNGGDGLAVARLLHGWGRAVQVYTIAEMGSGSKDFQLNAERAAGLFPVVYLDEMDGLKSIDNPDVIIDALFGSGLSRPLDGLAAKLVKYINDLGCKTVAIDIPSGLYLDKHSEGEAIIKAEDTITFQLPKLAFMMAENAEYFGKVHVVDIGLSDEAILKEETDFWEYGAEDAKQQITPRKAFSHKGNFGHALLIAGSRGQMGAAVMAAEACLRCGVGLLTISGPKAGEQILQIRVPEAMYLSCGADDHVDAELPKLDFDCIGMGPGIGKSDNALKALEKIIENSNCPLVLDADALNLLGENRELLKKLPKNSILTPHPKEFERLTSIVSNDFDRLKLAQEFAKEYSVTLVLKGGRTAVADATGMVTFNTTGNPGMATGGSGDVLTGIISGLCAQGFAPADAARLGVYVHGLAGDLAADRLGQQSMLATDIISSLSDAFLSLTK